MDPMRRDLTLHTPFQHGHQFCYEYVVRSLVILNVVLSSRLAHAVFGHFEVQDFFFELKTIVLIVPHLSNWFVSPTGAFGLNAESSSILVQCNFRDLHNGRHAFFVCSASIFTQSSDGPPARPLLSHALPSFPVAPSDSAAMWRQ